MKLYFTKNNPNCSMTTAMVQQFIRQDDKVWDILKEQSPCLEGLFLAGPETS